MTEVIMPKMGDGMEEGTLLEWLKTDGDAVKSGEVIGTIQTDKATLELESPGAGTLTGLLIQAGETVPVGRPIAAIVKAGEALPEGWGAGGAAPAPPAAAPETTAAAPTAVPTPELADDVASVGTAERVIASPLARKVAAEKGVDLAAVKGSGPGGRIVERDVLRALEMSPSTGPSVSVSSILQPAAEDQVVKLNRLRQITGQRTQQAKQQAPHFYVTVSVDLERIQALREQFVAEESGKVSVNEFVVKACALALREMPEVNASVQGPDSLLVHGAVNIGVAVALEDGLIVPVIKNADRLTLRQIAEESHRLVAKAREGKLHPDEMSGSTFSISNMGMLGVDNFAAIINQPNAAILAVSTGKKTVVVNEEDEIEVRLKMNVTGSFDHRVVDGAGGAKFVNLVKKYLENPTRLLA